MSREKILIKKIGGVWNKKVMELSDEMGRN